MQRIELERERELLVGLARTRWMFGLNMRLVTLFAWLTFWPAMRILPQTKHFAIGISWSDMKSRPGGCASRASG